MMGSVPQDGPEKNLLEMLNRQMRNGDKEFREFITDEDESRFNEVLGSAGALAYQVALQKQQQQPLVQWERFLPFRTLKVLLVESDDSTRHVVSALLRNCSYEVTAAANSLQAWNILEDLTNHIDLILAEVVMPCVSGIGLLCKIMSHKTCKNIPVIMMSSNDSMGTVFKCLSKGAVDFLVKPVRKNELKNLWQHVWRRCQSSSASVNESDIQTQRSAKSKGSDDSGSDTSSNDGYGNGLIDLNARDGSDNGSETQSSWAKHIAEEKDCDGSPSPSDQVVDPTTPSNKIKWEQKEDDLMGKDLEIGLPTNPDTRRESYPTDDLKFSEATAGSIDLPSLELSLKRPTATRLDINVLRPSNHSAFSRFQGINHPHLHTIQQPPDSTNEKCVRLDVFSGKREDESADSGSNCGSNGQKGSNSAFMDRGVDPDPFAVRAAALNKFRLKRKERNFEKKVRYQSRKRLAEQRPRVRGQFVREDKAGR